MRPDDLRETPPAPAGDRFAGEEDVSFEIAAAAFRAAFDEPARLDPNRAIAQPEAPRRRTATRPRLGRGRLARRPSLAVAAVAQLDRHAGRDRRTDPSAAGDRRTAAPTTTPTESRRIQARRRRAGSLPRIWARPPRRRRKRPPRRPRPSRRQPRSPPRYRLRRPARHHPSRRQPASPLQYRRPSRSGGLSRLHRPSNGTASIRFRKSRRARRECRGCPRPVTNTLPTACRWYAVISPRCPLGSLPAGVV